MIDLMSDFVMSELQIDKRVVAMIRQYISLEDEQKMSRILHGQAIGTYLPSSAELDQVAEYQVHVESCREKGNLAKEDADLLSRTLQYEAAVKRLACYRLAEGRPEQVAQNAVYDEETGELISEAVSYLPLIEPLPATVLDADGNEVPNPSIVKDDQERADAVSIISGAADEVLDLVNVRGRI